MSESIVSYGNTPIETFIVYKFDTDPNGSEYFTVQCWNDLTTEADYKKLIPDNYCLCQSININSRDYYLVVHLRKSEEAVSYYYVNGDSAFESLLKVALEKLDKLNMPVNKSQAILPQLMLAVFNEETADELEMKPSLRQDLEQEVILLLTYSDKEVMRMLNLVEQDRIQELLQKLIQATTEAQLREVLISDLLYRAMQELSDLEPQ